MRPNTYPDMPEICVTPYPISLKERRAQSMRMTVKHKQTMPA